MDAADITATDGHRRASVPVIAAILLGLSGCGGVSLGGDVWTGDIQPTVSRPASAVAAAGDEAAPADGPASRPTPPTPIPETPAATVTGAGDAAAPVASPSTPVDREALQSEPPAAVDAVPAETNVDDVSTADAQDEPVERPSETAPAIRRATGEDRTWPNLASVPPRPEEFSTPQARQDLRDRLTVDREEGEEAASALRDGSPAGTGPRDPQVPDAPPSLSDAPATLPETAAVGAAIGDQGAVAQDQPVLAATVIFDPQSAELAQTEVELLADVVETQRRTDGIVSVVVPLTGGSQLAAGRANIVARTLIDLGVPPTRIYAKAVAEDTQSSDVPANRAEIYLDY